MKPQKKEGAAVVKSKKAKRPAGVSKKFFQHFGSWQEGEPGAARKEIGTIFPAYEGGEVSRLPYALDYWWVAAAWFGGVEMQVRWFKKPEDAKAHVEAWLEFHRKRSYEGGGGL